MVRFEPPGVIGPSELRQILYEGRVGARLRPLADPAAPQAALYHALPRLRAADGSQLEPARYRTTAARCGLLGVIDRLLLLRCAEMLRATRAEGREALVLCTVAAASLTDPGFVAEVEQQLRDRSRAGRRSGAGARPCRARRAVGRRLRPAAGARPALWPAPGRTAAERRR